MARKVIGPTGSRRRRWLFLCTSFAAIAIAVVFIPSALAVHDLHFQLDGDTTSTAYSSPTPNLGVEYDWNDIFNVTNNAPVPPATVGTQTVSNNSANVGSGKTFDDASFTRDFETNATCPTTSAVGLNSLSTNFCTGDDTTYATGSKDTLGIGNGGWQCNHDNNVNSKIDITNAYITQYTAPNGHKIFYFGVERNVSNGTNDVGVWFLQSGASCSAPSGHLNFTGGHLDGDTLVVAEQTSGGGVSTAKAFRWAASTNTNSPFYGDGGCLDSNDNFNPAVVVNGTHGCNNLPIATGADCKTASGTDSLCATTNAFCPPPRKASDAQAAVQLRLEPERHHQLADRERHERGQHGRVTRLLRRRDRHHPGVPGPWGHHALVLQHRRSRHAVLGESYGDAVRLHPQPARGLRRVADDAAELRFDVAANRRKRHDLVGYRLGHTADHRNAQLGRDADLVPVRPGRDHVRRERRQRGE